VAESKETMKGIQEAGLSLSCFKVNEDHQHTEKAQLRVTAEEANARTVGREDLVVRRGGVEEETTEKFTSHLTVEFGWFQFAKKRKSGKTAKVGAGHSKEIG